MPNRCIVYKCHNSRRNNRDVTYHRLPLKKTERGTLKKWLLALKLENPPVNQTSAVCSLHFEASCFKPYGKKGLKTLKHDAVPTLHMTDGYAQSEEYLVRRNRSREIAVQTATESEDDEPTTSNSTFGEPIGTSTPTKNRAGTEFGVESPIERKKTKYDLDLPYVASSSSSESESEDSEEDEVQKLVDAKKFIVFEEQLLELVRCREVGCSLPVDDCQQHSVGSMVVITGTCLKGHPFKWSSQPRCGGPTSRPAGNVALAASTLFTGNTYSTIDDICTAMNLTSIKKTLFYEIQREILLPNIEKMYNTHIKDIRKAYEDFQGAELTVAGDARHDSPGHSADFGLYTLMDTNNDIILASKTVAVGEKDVPNSYWLENEGLKRCLKELKDCKIKIDTLVTDRHATIAKTMREKHSDIRHEFDVWHLAKSLRKKLNKKCNKYPELRPWQRAIVNHFWWSAETCNRSYTQFKERWTSILRHIVDVHEWVCCNEFHKCCHDPLEPGTTKPWLIEGSEAHKELQSIVMEKKFLKDLEQAIQFCHTGNLEAFHSMLLKYMPKRSKFNHECMTARGLLAVLDHNLTVDHEHGTLASDMKYSIGWSKRSKIYVVRRVQEAKDYSFRKVLMYGVFERAVHGIKDRSMLVDTESTRCREAHKTTKRGAKPSKEDAIASHISRLK